MIYKYAPIVTPFLSFLSLIIFSDLLPRCDSLLSEQNLFVWHTWSRTSQSWPSSTRTHKLHCPPVWSFRVSAPIMFQNYLPCNHVISVCVWFLCALQPLSWLYTLCNVSVVRKVCQAHTCLSNMNGFCVLEWRKVKDGLCVCDNIVISIHTLERNPS